MGGKFNTLICSDTDYEKLVAEIYFDGKFVALISQENGAENLKLEFSEKVKNESAVTRIVDLSGFIQVLGLARDKLLNEDHSLD